MYASQNLCMIQTKKSKWNSVQDNCRKGIHFIQNQSKQFTLKALLIGQAFNSLHRLLDLVPLVMKREIHQRSACHASHPITQIRSRDTWSVLSVIFPKFLIYAFDSWWFRQPKTMAFLSCLNNVFFGLRFFGLQGIPIDLLACSRSIRNMIKYLDWVSIILLVINCDKHLI